MQELLQSQTPTTPEKNIIRTHARTIRTPSSSMKTHAIHYDFIHGLT